jgi:PD-(D/E)XK nuclease superfamily protein
LEYQSIQVRRQWNNIDVLLVVNSDTAIIIEDKTDTKDHSGQLERYRKAVAGEFPAGGIAAVYLKTGDQGNYRSVEQAGYGRFLRRDFLDILDRGEQAGVNNDIFADFLRHLRGIEVAVQSFSSTPLGEWNKDWSRWKGFFLVLQERLGEGDWNYVANPSGGFMGFWWHWQGEKFLQLENEKLCFKVTVPDEAQQTAKWWEWHNALMAESGVGCVKIKKPVRREGKWMTVAVLDGDYRQSAEGHLDLDQTVETLRKAEALMDAALMRIANAAVLKT